METVLTNPTSGSGLAAPYARGAQVYWRRGWENPIPVGTAPKQKKPVPAGYTGREGKKVGHDQLTVWSGQRGNLNIAIRLPKFLIAFDIDGLEGADVLGQVEQQVGVALPAGPYSTSHGADSARRHRFYRIPTDLDLSRIEGVLRERYGDKLDLLHYGHRYAIVAPSIHPSGNEYLWYNEAGERCKVPVATQEVPQLPAEWVAFLRSLKMPAVAVDDDLFDDAVSDHLMTEEQVRDAWRRACARFGEKFVQGNRNNAVRDLAFESWHYSAVIEAGDVRAEVSRLGRERWPAEGWDVLDEDTLSTIERSRADAERQGQWMAEIVEPARLQADETPGLAILAPPGQPLKVARALKTLIPASDGVPHLMWWQDDFYRWTGAHWEVEPDPIVRRWLYQQTGDAVYLTAAKKAGDAPERNPWAPTKQKIANVMDALAVAELQHLGEEDRALAAANGVVVRRELLAHTPRRFNLFSLPFDYNPDARCPNWQGFLDQVLPDDGQAQDFLGEWFGYVLSGRTDQQKMAALIGKKRSGKGTIARVLTALVGKDNVSGLNLGLIGGTFGLEPFVGSALAVASDVRWHSRNIGDAVQVMLEISGEDHVTVHRKNKAAWKGRLGVRFMLMSNDTPTFSDRSGALVDRMLYVAFKQSFYGREDTALTEKLMGELSGILNWALDGLDRLDERGRFTQPESGRGEAEATRRLADPIGAFIEDWCTVDPKQAIDLDHLYLKYRNWCEGEGRTRDTTTKEIFSRDLRQKVDGLTSKRTRSEGKFVTVLHGIGSDAI